MKEKYCKDCDYWVKLPHKGSGICYNDWLSAGMEWAQGSPIAPYFGCIHFKEKEESEDIMNVWEKTALEFKRKVSGIPSNKVTDHEKRIQDLEEIVKEFK